MNLYTDQSPFTVTKSLSLFVGSIFMTKKKQQQQQRRIHCQNNESQKKTIEMNHFFKT